jgi:transmembrane sensor
MTETEKAMREALYWVLLLADRNPSPRFLTEFGAWLRASPEHVRLFQLAMAQYALGSRLGPITQETGEEWVRRGERIISAFNSAKEMPMANQIWRPSAHSTAPEISPSRRRYWHVAIGAALACVLAIGALWAHRSVGAWKSYVATSSHTASVRLEEGSVLALDPDSIADVRFSSQLREVRLQSGRATFVVVHDPARPFRVNVAFGTVEAIGTQFSVQVQESRAVIEVQDGAVRVTGRSPRDASIELAARERASILLDGSIEFIRRSGLMNGVPLRQIVESVNAKNRVPQIRVEGNACNRPMSGKWHFEDPEQLVRALTGMANLSLTRIGDEVVIRDRDDRSGAGGSSCAVGAGSSEVRQ